MESNNDSSTARNRGGKPFIKGDPRINRKGRPKSFDALRELAKQIAHEVATAKDEHGVIQPIIMDGHKVTNAEMVMRAWLKSGKPQLQQGFIEIAFGKVPTPIEIRDWREAAKASGIENPDEALNEIVGIIAARMARANDSGGDREGEGTETTISETVAAPSNADAAAG
jgi:hypothetical protein